MAAAVGVQQARPAPRKAPQTAPSKPSTAPSNSAHLTPKEVYGASTSSHVLKWSNGGAGPTGVLGALAGELLEKLSDTRIEWYMNSAFFPLL